MSDQELADRFSRDIDRLLEKSRVMELESAPNDNPELVKVAQALARADFSRESLNRGAIRHRLISRMKTAKLADDEREYLKSSRAMKLRKSLLISISSALAVLLLITFLSPGGPPAAAQSISNGAKFIVLGAYSTAQKIESFITGKTLPDDSWQVTLFRGAGVGGNGLPGTNSDVRTVNTYQDAQELAMFHIQKPGYLPAGYELEEIKLAPIWTGAAAIAFKPNPNAFLFFRGPGPDIVIAQQPVGPKPIGGTGLTGGQVIGFATNGTMDEVEMNGHTAAWVMDKLLVWEKGGLSFIVGGLGLDLDEAILIATSLD